MTRETKIGLLMVVMLVGVFGFMVYKKSHRPSEAMADQKLEVVAPDSDGEVLPFDKGGDNGDWPAQPPGRVIPAAATVPAKIPDNSSAVPVAQRDVNPFEVQSSPKVIVKPKLPTAVPPDDAFFDSAPQKTAAVEKREPAKASSSTAALDPFMEDAKPSTQTRVVAERSDSRIEASATANTDPFEAPLEVAQSAPPTVAQSAPVADADPFETNPSSNTNTEPAPTLAAPPRKAAALPTDPFDVVEEPKQTAPALTVPTFEPAASDFKSAPQPVPPTTIDDDDRLGGFRPVEVNKRAMNEFTREEGAATTAIPAGDPFGAARRPAPAARIDEDFAPRSTSQPLIPGDTYNIEPNDNYWTISRKKYGTGRYFMALSQHNLAVVPDPKRMKPGVTIATPSTDVLDKTYPTLIPQAAPSDSSPAGGISSSSTGIRRTNATTTDEAGFFVSTDGTPMYRIGSEDTLSGIAKQHLGRSSRWVQIFEMNRDTLTDGNTLTVGTLLRLPGDASRVDVVGAPRTVR